MNADSIILYAKLLRTTYHGKSIIEIANLLSYDVILLDTSPKFLIANTYKYNHGNKKLIFINSNYSESSKNVLCAHELGHAILNHPGKSNYKDNNLENEYYANLFAVSLLFNENDFNMKFKEMSNFVLQTILDKNIELIT